MDMNMEKNFGIQELYELKIKTTLDMTIGNRTYSAGETVFFFENAELSMLEEDIKLKGAFGGQYNQNLVFWRDLSSVRFGIDKGVLSELDLSVLLNARILQESPILIGRRETLVASADGTVYLTKTPAEKTKIFAYKETIEGFEKTFGTVGDATINFGVENASAIFVVDYSFSYSQGTSYFISNDELSGFFRVEAKTRLKDDVSGMERTGIIVIPNMQLTSGINIILGTKATPIVGNFMFTSISTPNVDKKQSPSENNSVYSMYILDTDIDAI
jgi:hypothetical protein